MKSVRSVEHRMEMRECRKWNAGCAALAKEREKGVLFSNVSVPTESDFSRPIAKPGTIEACDS